MRLYTFTNMYLSSIQNGIQSAHCLHEMFRKYEKMFHVQTREHNLGILYNWADNHKTIIVKNGGGTENMVKIKALVESMNLPYATFQEPSLDNALTCVGIIVPERLYDKNITNKLCEAWKRDKVENEFIELLNNTGMAR